MIHFSFCKISVFVRRDALVLACGGSVDEYMGVVRVSDARIAGFVILGKRVMRQVLNLHNCRGRLFELGGKT